MAKTDIAHEARAADEALRKAQLEAVIKQRDVEAKQRQAQALKDDKAKLDALQADIDAAVTAYTAALANARTAAHTARHQLDAAKDALTKAVPAADRDKLDAAVDAYIAGGAKARRTDRDDEKEWRSPIFTDAHSDAEATQKLDALKDGFAKLSDAGLKGARAAGAAHLQRAEDEFAEERDQPSKLDLRVTQCLARVQELTDAMQAKPLGDARAYVLWYLGDKAQKDIEAPRLSAKKLSDDMTNLKDAVAAIASRLRLLDTVIDERDEEADKEQAELEANAAEDVVAEAVAAL